MAVVSLKSLATDRPDIDAAVARLADDSRWKTRKALDRLAGRLEAAERVGALGCATTSVSPGTEGLVVVTDARLFWLGAGEEESGAADLEVSLGRSRASSFAAIGSRSRARTTRQPKGCSRAYAASSPTRP
jgi:hypothetical protein